MSTLTRLILLTATTLIGCALGQEIERQRQRRDMEDILSSTRSPDNAAPVGVDPTDHMPDFALGQSVVYTDINGTHRSARIVRIVDPTECVVDLHVDYLDPERPVRVVEFVPIRPPGTESAQTWMTRLEASALN